MWVYEYNIMQILISYGIEVLIKRWLCYVYAELTNSNVMIWGDTKYKFFLTTEPQTPYLFNTLLAIARGGSHYGGHYP